MKPSHPLAFLTNTYNATMQVMTKNGPFAGFLANPTVGREAKVEAIEKMFDGPKTSPVTKNLMVTMASNNRIGEADKVRSRGQPAEGRASPSRSAATSTMHP